MITIGAFVPQPDDATSWYRAYGPFRYLRKHCDLEILEMNLHGVRWSDLTRCDILFVQRPAWDSSWLQPLDLAQALGVPVWVDYDDDYFNVGHHNPNAWAFERPDSKNVVTQYLEKADAVTVSTSHLALEYGLKSSKTPVVIPNAMDPAVTFSRSDFPKKKKHILWRGAASHIRDLRVAEEWFCGLGNDFHVTFLGTTFPWFLDKMKCTTQVINEPMSVPRFFNQMARLAPDFVVVPLENDYFTQSKSDIAYLEATAAGALCLGPNRPPWSSDPGITLYDEFLFNEAACKFVTMSGEEYASKLEKACEYIAHHRMLTCQEILEPRLEIIAKLTGKTLLKTPLPS